MIFVINCTVSRKIAGKWMGFCKVHCNCIKEKNLIKWYGSENRSRWDLLQDLSRHQQYIVNILLLQYHNGTSLN
jgi:hypothetical protein